MKMMVRLNRSSRRHGLLFLGVSLVLLAALPGCIRSRVKITSDPSGAEVIWRGKPYGATPVTIPFIWYWYYDITIEKPGYKRLEVTERFRAKPWFIMPLDLVMEVIPVPIPDTRERHYVLQPLGQEGKPVTAPEMVLTPEMLKSIESQKAPQNKPAQPPQPAAPSGQPAPQAQTQPTTQSTQPTAPLPPPPPPEPQGPQGPQ